jgi:signal transduction histidine kinase
LGLAIVKKIIEEHHGMIRIENVQPHGAIVCIRLPAAQGEAA